MNMPPRELSVEMSARLEWPLDAAADPTAVNAFAVLPGAPISDSQVERSVFMVMGQTIPPLFTDETSVERFKAQASTITVKPVASFTFTVERAVELRDLLSNVIAHFERLNENESR